MSLSADRVVSPPAVNPAAPVGAALIESWQLPATGLIAVLLVAVVFLAIRLRRQDRRHRDELERAVEEHSAQLRRALEEADKEKRQLSSLASTRTPFLANASHELRTPLNSVLGMNSLLLDTELTPQQRELAYAVQTSAEAMLTVLNDLIDVSRANAGKLVIEEMDLHLRQVVESAAEVFAARAYERNVELVCLVHGEIPSHLRGDAGRIRQVLVNLLGNTIKHTAGGEVLVEARLESDDDASAEVRIEVCGTGVTDSPAVIARLFDPPDPDAPPPRRYDGRDIALFLSRRLVELMDGEIGAQSRGDDAATFWFTVRLRRPSPRKADRLTRTQISFGDTRVIIADPHEVTRRALSHYVRSWGMRLAQEAATATEVLIALRRLGPGASPAVLILNHTLVDIDGLQLVERIRSDSQLADTRIVMLTPLAVRIDPEVIRRAGCQAWVTKPVRHSHLLNALQQISIPGRPIPAALSSIAPAKIGPAGPDMAGLRVLIAEDNLPNQVFARRLMLRLGFEASLAPDGRKALEALAADAYDLILMDCHMPVMDGFEATRLIRGSGKPWARVPIIAVTADVVDGTREACLEAGMNDYVTKPLKAAELLASIRRVLGLPAEKAEQPAEGTPA